MAKIKKIKLGATTYDLCDADAVHVVKQDGVTGATANRFGTCSTAAATAAKTVSITAGTFSLETGAKVTVKFSNKNTAGTPTLNVNGTGAKKIFHNGAQITTSGNKALLAGTVEFVYDGTQWHLIGNYVDSHKSHAIISGTKADGTTEIKGASSSGDLTLGNSGVTQGAYGPASDPAPAQHGTFSVPYLTVNTKGIVTAAATKTVTLPEETAISIVNKDSGGTEKDTTDLLYVVSNLVESGTKNHSITPTYSGVPTKAYVDKVATGHVKYLGTVSALSGLSTTAGQGDFYRVSTAFTFGSETAHVGDIVLAIKDNPAQTATDWDLIHTEVDTNTWVANTTTAAGYVAAPTTSNPNKVWRTDGNGSPAWRDPSTPEAFLTWGGQNFTGAYGPIDAAMIPQLGANRFAFFPKANVVLEYSTNGGSTWTALNNDNMKAALFSVGGAGFYIGNTSAKGIDKSAYMCRVTITTSGVCYSALNKFAIYLSTGGSSGCKCTITARTKANQDAGNNTWVTFADKVPVDGWSGWNIINTPSITTHGNTTAQYSQLRFTFGVTSHASTVNYEGLNISKIMAFGGVGWTTPSTMAASGDIYSYDAAQNVTFPGNITTTGSVTAASFSGSGANVTSLNANNISSGTLPVARGGTGQTTLENACNSLLNGLSTGSSAPNDADYFISQYAGGGTTTTTYHRRPVSALYDYIQSKADNRYLQLTGGTLSGALTVNAAVTGNSFSGVGTNLTALNASQLTSGTVAFARLPTGTTSSTVAVGNHTHLYAGSASVGGPANSVKTAVTFNNSGSGAASGTTFDGSTARTISYNTIGAASSGHTHSTTLASDTGTSSITLSHGGKYKLTAGGNSVIFTLPGDNNSYHTTGSWSGLTYTAAAQGGAGELKFTIPTGTSSTTVAVGNHTHLYAGSASAGGPANSVKTAVTFNNSGSGAASGTTFNGSEAKTISYNTVGAAASNHTHTCSIASSTGTSSISLAHGSKYSLTAGGSSYIFTMPSHSDQKVKVTTATTTKAYILGASSYTSGSATDNVVADTGVYLSTTAGQLTATSFYATSDKRLKENLTPYACEKSILELPVYKYNFIKDKAKTEHIGCLAQDLQEICPEIVCAEADGYLTINESKIVYLLLNEVKKLKSEVEELKTKV